LLLGWSQGLFVPRTGKHTVLRFALPAVVALMLGPSAGLSQTPAASAEAWVGAESFKRVWSLYSGTTFAPFGPLAADGARLRAVAGYGDYRTGTVSFADLLVGYHAQLGELTIKVFGGVMLANHGAASPFSELDGMGVGAKGVVETWWNITDKVWLNTDVAYGTLHDTYAGRTRLGWRFTPQFSVGLEGGAAGSSETDIARAGGFVRYEWAGGEASLSGGMAREGFDILWDDTTGAYATLSVLSRF
jgi:hypothetical protein